MLRREAEIVLGGEEQHEPEPESTPTAPRTGATLEGAVLCDFCHEPCRPFGRHHFLRTPVRKRQIGPSHRFLPLRV